MNCYSFDVYPITPFNWIHSPTTILMRSRVDLTPYTTHTIIANLNGIIFDEGHQS